MNPADLDSLEKADKDELLGIIETMQTRDRCVRQLHCTITRTHALTQNTRTSLRMYNGLVERCFMTCVDSFRRKTLEKNEEQARPPACSAAPHPGVCVQRLRLIRELTRRLSAAVRDQVLREVLEAQRASERSLRGAQLGARAEVRRAVAQRQGCQSGKE